DRASDQRQNEAAGDGLERARLVVDVAPIHAAEQQQPAGTHVEERRHRAQELAAEEPEDARPDQEAEEQVLRARRQAVAAHRAPADDDAAHVGQKEQADERRHRVHEDLRERGVRPSSRPAASSSVVAARNSRVLVSLMPPLLVIATATSAPSLSALITAMSASVPTDSAARRKASSASDDSR